MPAQAQSSGESAASGPLGTVESALGKATGCEGMESEGEQRKQAADSS